MNLEKARAEEQKLAQKCIDLACKGARKDERERIFKILKNDWYWPDSEIEKIKGELDEKE